MEIKKTYGKRVYMSVMGQNNSLKDKKLESILALNLMYYLINS